MDISGGRACSRSGRGHEATMCSCPPHRLTNHTRNTEDTALPTATSILQACTSAKIPHHMGQLQYQQYSTCHTGWHEQEWSRSQVHNRMQRAFQQPWCSYCVASQCDQNLGTCIYSHLGTFTVLKVALRFSTPAVGYNSTDAFKQSASQTVQL